MVSDGGPGTNSMDTEGQLYVFPYTSGRVGNTGRAYMPDKGMIYLLSGTDGIGAGFHYATQKGLQFKTYKLFISVIFHLIFLDWG